VREDEIYLLTKQWVIRQKLHVLGGQPPNGTDRFPVIEIKSDQKSEKGSRTSFKPDLVVATTDLLLIIECKPRFDSADVTKLNEIAESPTRLDAFIRELRQRRSLERRDLSLSLLSDHELVTRTRFCVAYSGQYYPVPNMYSLVFSPNASTHSLYFGDSVAENFAK
jgi:hypothetical protein